MVCETFGCLPDEALRQDWPTVVAILDYRAATRALELFNGGSKGMSALAKAPALQQILLDMTRAQGAEQTWEQFVATTPRAAEEEA